MSGRLAVAVRRLAAGLVAVAAVSSVGQVAAVVVAGSRAPTTSGDAVRAAKLGWTRFVAGNVVAPTAVSEPCPMLSAEAASAAVADVGAVPSALPSGVWLDRRSVGAGIISIACGVDLADASEPAGSTGLVVEATILDGQVGFAAYAEHIAGRDVEVAAAPVLGGEQAGRCRNDPTMCVASWHSDGLVVTVKLDGPRSEASESQAFQLLEAVAPTVLTNLAAVS